MSAPRVMNHDDVHAASSDRAAWEARAEDLAAWALARMFVRRDRYGGYYVDAKTGGTKKSARPNAGCKEPLSPAVVARHFRARRPEDVIGAYLLTDGKDSMGRWVCIDIDNHDKDAETAKRNTGYALHLHAKLTRLGISALLATWGGGGYHLSVYFRTDVPGAVLSAFGKWIVSDAAEFGLASTPEVFPKQEAVETGKFGNWIRLVGRHHTRDVFASVYVGDEWVRGERAVEYILSLEGDSPGLIPREARPKPAPPPNPPGGPSGPSGPGFRVRGDPADVLKAFGEGLGVEGVARLHEEMGGHRVTSRKPGRVDFTRNGKNGSAESFNVKLIGGIPITYNFSTNAGMPTGQGLTPAQIFCFYNFGSCDRETMAKFAAQLRAESAASNGTGHGGKKTNTATTRGAKENEENDVKTDEGRDEKAAESPRPVIQIGTDEHRVNDEAVAALARDQEIYTRAGQLVRVINEREETFLEVKYPAGPRILPVSPATLRERLTFVATWKKGTDKGAIDTTPPQPTVMAIHDRGDWPGVRRLVSVTEYPVVLGDGSILATIGYHRQSGLMYAPRFPVRLSVTDSPTPAAARAAAAELVDVVCEFPFVADHHRAAWVAGLLTPLARFAFDGPAPMFLAEANVAGAGKLLLVDAMALIVRGATLPVNTFPHEGSELRKRVTAMLVRGSTMVLFDNITGRLGGAELDALLTSTTWTDRPLQETKIVEVPALTTWYATGNNVAVKGDTMRRIAPIRLMSTLENPEERQDIKRKDLRAWVRAERPRLLSAALTVLRGYIKAGLPDMNLPAWGSFEGWSRVVRGAVVWAGLADPWNGRQAMRDDRGDEQVAAIGGLLRLWEEVDTCGNGLTAANIVRRIDAMPEDHPLPEILLALTGPKVGDEKEDGRPRTLGYRIRESDGRVIGGRRLVKAGMSAGLTRWKVETIDATAASAM